MILQILVNKAKLFSLSRERIWLLGLLTWQQSASYRDNETLWRTTIDRNPGCWMVETNLGSELLEGAGIDGAIAHLERPAL